MECRHFHVRSTSAFFLAVVVAFVVAFVVAAAVDVT
jgi:hypothetical protein